MNKFISEQFAIKGLFIILAIFVIFHLLVLLRIIPFEIVWGGRFNNPSQMSGYETVSVIINLVMLVVAGIKAHMLKVIVHNIIIKILLWLMFALFLVNTVGNLFSNNEFEKLVFAPITLILSVFCLRLAMGRDKKKTTII